MTKHNTRIEIHLGDANYPESLLDLPAPPRALYVRGDPAVLHTPALAIVGARSATPYGLAVAEAMATVAAESGITVVSGGARGCDHAAGAACLRAHGRHVVVLGCGADVVYPRSTAPLIDRTLDEGGAVVSLERWGTTPRPYMFPKRNRVIAALARAVCVTEAGLPSGTFSTADTATEIGREILAVPGSILSPTSRGANQLIANGACCIVDEESLEVAISRIFGTLRHVLPEHPSAPGPDERDAQLMAALTASPLRADDIAAMLGMDPVSCLSYLSGLVVEGRIERLLDGRFSPTVTALHEMSAIMHNR